MGRVFPDAEAGRGREDENDEVVVEDFAGKLKLYADGSVLRTAHQLIIDVPPSKDDPAVASRDVVINKELGIWVRIYLPIPLVNIMQSQTSKLPVLLYFHGGVFCFLSPACIAFHRLCQNWAAAMGAVVISVNYRLAPEHRLPAAYDDSMEVVQWLRYSSSCPHSDTWLNAYADLINVFLVGESCGGNIVHHLLMRMNASEFGMIKGAILLQPFFGGEERTESEIVCPVDSELSVNACDTLWRLALPAECGGNRDHPFSNPVKYMKLQKNFLLPLPLPLPLPPMLVVLGGKDCLSDRGVEYYEAISKSGYCNNVDLMLFDEEDHGFHHFVKESDNENSNNNNLMRQTALFISSNCTVTRLASI